MSVSVVRRVAPIACALGLAALAACSERTLAPAATGPSFSFQGGNGGSFHQRNGCGDGRAGSAALTVLAVYARDGSTEITVTSYSAKDTLFATPAGCITSLDLTAYAPNADDGGHGYDRGHRDFWFSGRDHGSQRWSRHFARLNTGSSFTVTVTGLQPGMRIQAEADVGCLSRGRTDDVTAQTNVIRRTDPAVTSLTVPATAYVNLPVLVTAQITELNGQQGAAGTCYLTVGSTLTDSLPNVAVAAGDSVVCSFAPIFGTVGTRQITVSYASVVPRDDNTANNSASRTVVVAAASSGGGGTTPPAGTLQPFVVNASVYDDTALVFSDVFAMSERLAGNLAVLYDTTNFTTATTGNVQYAGFDGVVYEAVPFPLASLTVSQVTGTTTYHSQSWTNVAASGTSSANSQCANLLSGIVTLVVCAYSPDAVFPYGRTTVSYVRSDSNVSQVQSAYYVNYTGPTPTACDPASTDPSQPCYTIATALGPALPHYQSAYNFNVVLETTTRRYSANVTVPLGNAYLDQSVPYACSQYAVTGGDNVTVVQNVCEGTQDARWRKSGAVPGLIALTQAK